MAVKQKNKKNSSFLVFLGKYWWIVGIVILFIGSVSYIAYNKYLDKQNVSNMERLLADFEQLERDVESQTGEKFYIEADCSSVGKFATSYACSLNLKPVSGVWTISMQENITNNLMVDINKSVKCGLLSEIGYKVQNLEDNYLACRSFSVRGSNEQKAEEIFYNYDTSPNSPLSN